MPTMLLSFVAGSKLLAGWLEAGDGKTAGEQATAESTVCRRAPHRIDAGFAAAQGCQALGTLALHQGLQGLPKQGAALQRAAQLLGASQEFIDERDGVAHGQKQAATSGCIHSGIIW